MTSNIIHDFGEDFNAVGQGEVCSDPISGSLKEVGTKNGSKPKGNIDIQYNVLQQKKIIQPSYFSAIIPINS